MEEGKRLGLKNYRTMRKHFIQTGQECSEILQGVSLKWAELGTHLGLKLSKEPEEKRKEVSMRLRAELGLPLK